MKCNTVRYWDLRRVGSNLVLPILLLALGDTHSLQEWLRYQRGSIIEQHQYWRLISAHLVHANWHHTLLNLAGFMMISVLFQDTYKYWQWLCIGLISAICIDLGLVFLMPNLHWYLGLSGVLHGALAAGAVYWWRFDNKLMALMLTGLLVSKLAWEQWQGALPLSGELNVVVNAHLFGAFGGLLASVVMVACHSVERLEA